MGLPCQKYRAIWNPSLAAYVLATVSGGEAGTPTAGSSNAGRSSNNGEDGIGQEEDGKNGKGGKQIGKGGDGVGKAESSGGVVLESNSGEGEQRAASSELPPSFSW